MQKVPFLIQKVPPNEDAYLWARQAATQGAQPHTARLLTFRPPIRTHVSQASLVRAVAALRYVWNIKGATRDSPSGFASESGVTAFFQPSNRSGIRHFGGKPLRLGAGVAPPACSTRVVAPVKGRDKRAAIGAPLTAAAYRALHAGPPLPTLAYCAAPRCEKGAGARRIGGAPITRFPAPFSFFVPPLNQLKTKPPPRKAA